MVISFYFAIESIMVISFFDAIKSLLIRFLFFFHGVERPSIAAVADERLPCALACYPLWTAMHC